MRLLGYKVFHRKLKIYSMSIRKGNVECIIHVIAQDYHKRRHKKCDYQWSTPLEFICLSRSLKRNAWDILHIQVAKVHVLSI